MQPQYEISHGLAWSLQVFDTKLQQKHPNVNRYLTNMYGQPQALLLLKQHIKPPAKAAHYVAANGNGALGPGSGPLAAIMHLMEQPWTGEQFRAHVTQLVLHPAGRIMHFVCGGNGPLPLDRKALGMETGFAGS